MWRGEEHQLVLLGGEQLIVGLAPSGLADVVAGADAEAGVLGRTSRKGRRVQGSLWVSKEGGGDGNSCDTVHGVEGKGGLPPTAHQPRNLATELFTRSFC